MTSAAEPALVHLIVGKSHARSGKQGRVTGDTEVLIVLPVREYAGRGWISLAMFLHDGNAHLRRYGQYGRRGENKSA